ncbi:MAG: Xaa-Pro peptidase family protein [Nitrospirota bacterium]
MSGRTGPLLEKLRGSLARQRIDGLLVMNITNVRYLTGFSGSSGFILITKKEQIFATDFRYREQSGKEIGGYEVVIERGERAGLVRQLCKRKGIKQLGFESSVSYQFYRSLLKKGLKLRAVSRLVEKLREVKEAEEILNIRTALKRAEAAFLAVKPRMRAGVRERAIALRLEEQLKKRGSRRIPFDIIVASGPNSALPHAKPTDKKLDPGDLVIIDWGAEADGYFSDLTRTLLLKGHNPNRSKQREIYAIVLEANKRAVAAASPGTGAKTVDSAARTYIKKSGYGEFFGHGTGHGVGLEIHEAPRIAWNSRDRVRKNMVFTIEPGIYIPGLGGVRIEDMIRVGDEQAEVLTSLNKELEVI